VCVCLIVCDLETSTTNCPEPILVVAQQKRRIYKTNHFKILHTHTHTHTHTHRILDYGVIICDIAYFSGCILMSLVLCYDNISFKTPR